MASVKLTDSGDIKLYILCIMQNIGEPLEYSDINDVALYDQLITNLDFIEAFDALVKDGLVIKNENNEYFVSEEGRFIASSLKSDLSGYIHERSLRAAIQNISLRRDNFKKNAEITHTDDGKYVLRLTLKKDGVMKMDVRLTLDTEYQAQKMAVAFSEKPELIYARLIAILSGE